MKTIINKWNRKTKGKKVYAYIIAGFIASLTMFIIHIISLPVFVFSCIYFLIESGKKSANKRIERATGIEDYHQLHKYMNAGL
jgi:hypothetical protein